MIGTTLAHYRITAALGAGGMGEVYRATDTRLGREVALKVLPSEMAASAERLDRFRREAMTLASLDHPGVVGVYSVEESDGVHFLTMQLVEGRALDQLIPECGMPFDRLLDIADALTEALSAAHDKGIIHRDLKPSNVMVTKDDRVKVLDFGLAKMTAAPPDESLDSEMETDLQTREGVVMGTMPYMSPEQVSGRAVDLRTDIFSLGIVLYEMASGRLPFAGKSTAELGSAILRDTPPSMTGFRADVPGGLMQVIDRCLEKDPDDRFQSAGDVLGALREAVASRPVASTSGPRPTFSRLLKIGGGVAFVLAVASTLSLLNRSRGVEEKTTGLSPAMTAASVKAERRPSVAVLPFANLSGDPEQEYFSDGMAEEVLNALASVPGLNVAARSSAFSFKGRNVDARTIGEQLDVAHVLEGSVRKSGSRLRINVQLVSTKDGYQLWNQVFDREMTDVFAIQEEIAQAIVRALSAELGVGRDGVLVQPGTSNLEAYNAYLRGRFRLGTYSREATEQSIRDFEKAVALDPDFADAYGGLAMAWANLNIWVPSGEVADALKRSSARALELDPDQPGALAGMAWYIISTSWDWRAAEELSLRAVAHQRQDPFAVDFYAALQLSPTGRTDEAVALFRKVLETDPLNTIFAFDLGWVLMIGGRPDEALVEIDALLAATPDYSWGHALRAWALAELGRPTELTAELERVPDSNDELILFTRVVAHHALGDEKAVTRLTERLRTLATTNPVDSLWLAWALLRSDHVEAGLLELERALDERIFQVPMSRTLFARDPDVRDRPRFQMLLKRMRLDSASLREQGFEVQQ